MNLATLSEKQSRSYKKPISAAIVQVLAKRVLAGRYIPRGSAEDLQTSDRTEIVLSGPAGTGKTRACLEKLCRVASNNHGLHALIVRKQRSDLSESALVTLERDVLGFDHPLVIDGPQRTFRHTYRMDNGSVMVIGGLDKPGKILSSEYDMIYVNQVEELAQKDWETLLMRLRGTAIPQNSQQIIGDCNPASPQHWLLNRQSLKLWPTYHKDNPLLFDDQGTITEYGLQYIGKLELLTGTMRERYLEGKWTQAEGVVYSEFGIENMTDDEPEPDLPIELAVDDGYVDPRAILFIQRTADRILVFDELYHSNHLAETCISEILERCKLNGWPLPNVAIGSPEAKELERRFRMAGIAYDFQTHQVVDGIQVVRRLVLDGQGYRALQINRRCKNFIGEMTDGYRYPELGSRRDDEKPLDGNDHACDAFRYWAYMRFGQGRWWLA